MGGDMWTMPSVNQIIDGLSKEAKLLIRLAMGDVHNQFKVVEAENNAAQAWNKLFATAAVQHPDAPLVWGS